MNKKIIAVIAAVVIVFVALFTYIFLTKESVVSGKILEITGLVEVKKKDSKDLVKVFANMAFTEGDVLFTREDGRAHLEIDESKDVEVASNTELAFTELKKSIKANQGKTHLELKEGKVKIKISKKLEGDSKFQIETPNAIMGVMGTEFYVYHDENGTWVGVIEGQVEVTKPNGEKVVLVPRGKAVLIKPDGQVEEKELTPEKEAEFYENATRVETPEGMAEFVLQENEEINDDNPEPTPTVAMDTPETQVPTPTDNLDNNFTGPDDDDQGLITEEDTTPIPTPPPTPTPPTPPPTPRPDDEDPDSTPGTTPPPTPGPNPDPNPGTTTDPELEQAKSALNSEITRANSYKQKNELSTEQKNKLDELINQANTILSNSTNKNEIQSMRQELINYLASLDSAINELVQAKKALNEEIERARKYMQKDELTEEIKESLEELIQDATELYNSSTDKEKVVSMRQALSEYLAELDKYIEFVQVRNALYEEIERAIQYMQKEGLTTEQKEGLEVLINQANDLLESSEKDKNPYNSMLNELKQYLNLLDDYIDQYNQAKNNLNQVLQNAKGYLNNDELTHNYIVKLGNLIEEAEDIYENSTSLEDIQNAYEILSSFVSDLDEVIVALDEAREASNMAYDYFESGLIPDDKYSMFENYWFKVSEVWELPEPLTSAQIRQRIKELRDYLSMLGIPYEDVLDFIQTKNSLWEQIETARQFVESAEADLTSEQKAALDTLIEDAENVYYNSKDLAEIQQMLQNLTENVLPLAKDILSEKIGIAKEYIQSGLLTPEEKGALETLISEATSVIDNEKPITNVLEKYVELNNYLAELSVDYEFVKLIVKAKNALSQEIERAKEIKQYESLTDAQKTDLGNLISEAEGVKANSINVDEIYSKLSDLIEKEMELMNYLLEKEIEKAFQYMQSGLLSLGEIEGLETLINQANSVLMDESAELDDLQAMYKELNNYLTNLPVDYHEVLFAVLRNALYEEIEKAKEFKYRDDLNDDQKTELENLISEATSIYDASTSIEEIEEILDKLRTKLSELDLTLTKTTLSKEINFLETALNEGLLGEVSFLFIEYYLTELNRIYEQSTDLEEVQNTLESLHKIIETFTNYEFALLYNELVDLKEKAEEFLYYKIPNDDELFSSIWSELSDLFGRAYDFNRNSDIEDIQKFIPDFKLALQNVDELLKLYEQLWISKLLVEEAYSEDTELKNLIEEGMEAFDFDMLLNSGIANNAKEKREKLHSYLSSLNIDLELFKAKYQLYILLSSLYWDYNNGWSGIFYEDLENYFDELINEVEDLIYNSSDIGKIREMFELLPLKYELATVISRVKWDYDNPTNFNFLNEDVMNELLDNLGEIISEAETIYFESTDLDLHQETMKQLLLKHELLMVIDNAINNYRHINENFDITDEQLKAEILEKYEEIIDEAKNNLASSDVELLQNTLTNIIIKYDLVSIFAFELENYNSLVNTNLFDEALLEEYYKVIEDAKDSYFTSSDVYSQRKNILNIFTKAELIYALAEAKEKYNSLSEEEKEENTDLRDLIIEGEWAFFSSDFGLIVSISTALWDIVNPYPYNP